MISSAEISTLKDFASHENHPIVSLYLNVDGAKFPTRADYETEFSILASNIRKTVREEMSFSKDQEIWLDGELSAIGEYLAFQFQRNGTRSLVIFTCKPENLWQVNQLKIAVNNRLFVDSKPQMAPLVEQLCNFENTCVLVTNKETARIFQAFAGEIAEQTEIFDSVLKHHEQGGWEQAKLQRRHGKQVRNHLKKASEATLEHYQHNGFSRVAVGVSEELWPELDRVLHPYLKERLLGRFQVDINASPDEILSKVISLEEEKRRAEEASLLSSLAAELDAGRIFVGGLDDVLGMLNQRRVDLLVVERGYSEPGRKCGSCGTLEFSEKACPACGRAGESIGDVVEQAKELAVRQDARVLTIEPGHPAMAQAQRIAARLRY